MSFVKNKTITNVSALIPNLFYTNLTYFHYILTGGGLTSTYAGIKSENRPVQCISGHDGQGGPPPTGVGHITENTKVEV